MNTFEKLAMIRTAKNQLEAEVDEKIAKIKKEFSHASSVHRENYNQTIQDSKHTISHNPYSYIVEAANYTHVRISQNGAAHIYSLTIPFEIVPEIIKALQDIAGSSCDCDDCDITELGF